ncbi:hypothetical protein PsalN5692_02159 [Piscirickettsia salmonis]|nr:hypothetical protein PsalN5692_02159 [Piscirickettsia salmonis]
MENAVTLYELAWMANNVYLTHVTQQELIDTI